MFFTSLNIFAVCLKGLEQQNATNLLICCERGCLL